MSSRDTVRVLFATVVLLLAGGVAYAQGTATAPNSPAASTTETPATAQKDAVQQNAEPEWRWRFLSVGGDVNETSAYVWRGWVLHDGACLQPDVWVKIADFTVTSWINVRNRMGGDSNLNEYDLTVDYSHGVGRLTLSAGWTNYRFFGHESGHSNEFYVGARADVLLQPGVQVYQDVEQGNGTYVSLSAGHEFPLGKQLTGATQVALGYNNHQYMAISGFSDVGVTFKVSVPVAAARLALQPTITYSHSLMPDMFPNRLFGGLSVAFK
jgi:hypothetical protein